MKWTVRRSGDGRKGEAIQEKGYSTVVFLSNSLVKAHSGFCGVQLASGVIILAHSLVESLRRRRASARPYFFVISLFVRIILRVSHSSEQRRTLVVDITLLLFKSNVVVRDCVLKLVRWSKHASSSAPCEQLRGWRVCV